jgi:hypothetical protein
MSVDPIALFNDRIGPAGILLDVVNEFMGATGAQLATDLPTRWQTFFDAYDAEDPDGRGWIDGMLAALGVYRGAAPAFNAQIGNAIERTLIGMVHADNRLPEATIALAMAELITQMNDQGDLVGDLVTNGGFADDTDWTKGAGWTIAGNVADCDGTQVADSDLEQDVDVIEGQYYLVTYTVSDYTIGDIDVHLAGTAGTTRSSAATFAQILVAGSGSAPKLELRADAAFDGKVDDVSVVPVALTVDANTVTATPTDDADNVGDGVTVISVLDGSGRTLEYAYAEDLEVTVPNADTAGGEELEVKGEEAIDDKRDWQWPKGSGSTQSYTATDAGGGANLITNGDFEGFNTTDTPNDWDIDVGTPGTDILESDVEYKGAKAIRFDDDTAEPAISQELTGLEARVPYAVNVMVREAAGSFGAGDELVIDLYDGAAVIADEAGTDNELVIDLENLGTTYISKTVVFRLPEPVPETVTLRVYGNGILGGGDDLLIDHLAMVAMTQQYDAGPYIAFFSGADDWSEDDLISIVIANDYAGQVQHFFWRVFDMPSLGLILPSATGGAETILDSIFTP